MSRIFTTLILSAVLASGCHFSDLKTALVTPDASGVTPLQMIATSTAQVAANPTNLPAWINIILTTANLVGIGFGVTKSSGNTNLLKTLLEPDDPPVPVPAK